MSRNPHHSRYYLYTKKSLYPPQNIQNAPHFGKLREIRQPFLYLDHKEWKPKISQQIA